MLSFPNCKINIGLNILQKRPDGFHNIETFFYPVGLSDILEFVTDKGVTDRIKLTVTGNPIDCPPEKNLCYRAYQILQSEYDLPPVNIHLHKVIPSGAGLGGGSSDAAFMIKMIARKFELPLTQDDLLSYASKLGSDCAFFIKNKPLLGYEKGNLFREIDKVPDIPGIVIVHPGIHVSTAEAYAGIRPSIPSARLDNLISHPFEEWKGQVVNDFEQNIIQKYPVIGEIKARLYSLGAVYASMSGSGSAVYGLFKGEAPSVASAFPGMFFRRFSKT